MGSSSKSSSSSSTVDQTSTVTGYGEGDVSNVSSTFDLSTGKNSTVNLTETDQGAIDAAKVIALGQIEFQEGMFSTTAQLLDQTIGTAFGILSDTNKRAIETVAGQSAATVSAVERANRGESSEQARLLVIGGAALTGIVAIVMMVRAFK